jgi:hypothetical protein
VRRTLAMRGAGRRGVFWWADLGRMHKPPVNGSIRPHSGGLPYSWRRTSRLALLGLPQRFEPASRSDAQVSMEGFGAGGPVGASVSPPETGAPMVWHARRVALLKLSVGSRGRIVLGELRCRYWDSSSYASDVDAAQEAAFPQKVRPTAAAPPASAVWLANIAARVVCTGVAAGPAAVDVPGRCLT